MSIIRIGLAQTKKFSEGYDAIFGKKSRSTETKPAKPAKAKARKAKSTAKKPKKAGKK